MVAVARSAYMESLQEPRVPYMAGQDDATPAIGVMTGLANDVADRLERLDIPNSPRKLLERIRRRTFGNAGWQRRAGQESPGLWCVFDLAEWTRDAGWDKSNLRRTLQWLIEHHIILHVTEPGSGAGRVGWNVHLDEWQGMAKGGARPGAGAPKGNQNARKYARQESVVSLIDLSRERSQIDCSEEPKTINLTTKNNQSDYENREKTIKLTTETGSKAGNQQARRGAKEYVNNSEEYILVRADATDDAAPSAAPSSTPKQPSTYEHDSAPYRLAVHLRDKILAHKPNARMPKTEKELQSWARPIDLMIRIDKREPQQIQRVIDWATQHEFWQPNILSPGKLREKFDTLEMQMQRKPGKQSMHSTGTDGPEYGRIARLE